MEITIKTLHEDMMKLQRELDFIKRALLNEGKLTPWAQKELKKARSEKAETYTSLEEL